MAVQVEAHSQPHQSGFEREERQESLQHPRYGEQRNDPGKRTCHIVVKNTEKFPAQFTGEGVEQTAVSVHEIPQGVIEADILCVQIQRQHAVIPERMHTLRNVQEQKKYGGHASGNEQVAVLTPPRAETAAEAGHARFGSGCIAGFVHGNIRLILIHGSDYPFFFKRRVLSVAFGCIRGRFHPPHRFLKPQALNSHVPPATEAEYPHLTACAQYAEAGRAAGMLLFQFQHIAGFHSDDRQRAPPLFPASSGIYPVYYSTNLRSCKPICGFFHGTRHLLFSESPASRISGSLHLPPQLLQNLLFEPGYVGLRNIQEIRNLFLCHFRIAVQAET